MYTAPLQLSDVIYNAANQSFEALVSVHDASGTSRYACAIDAPIDMEFEIAATGLSTQALRRHTQGRRDSVVVPSRAVQRSGRPAHERCGAIGIDHSAYSQAA